MCLNAMNDLSRLAFNVSICHKDDEVDEFEKKGEKQEGEIDDTLGSEIVLEEGKQQPHQNYLPPRLTFDTYPQLFEAQRIVNSFFAMIREDIIDMRQEYYVGKTWWGHFIFLPRLYLLPTGSNIRGSNNNNNNNKGSSSSLQEVKRGGGGGGRFMGEDVARHVLQAMMVICRILWSLELLLLPATSTSCVDVKYSSSKHCSSESVEWDAFCVKQSDVLARLSRLLPAVCRLYSERKRLSALHPSIFCIPISYSHKKWSAKNSTTNKSADVEEALNNSSGLTSDGDIKKEFESLLQIWESWKKHPPFEDTLCSTRFTALSVLTSCYIEHLRELQDALNAFYDAQQVQHLD